MFFALMAKAQVDSVYTYLHPNELLTTIQGLFIVTQDILILLLLL